MPQNTLRPRSRPERLTSTVTTRASAPVPIAGQTPATVQNIANTKVDLPATQPLLLGIFGKQDNPHALIRLPSGQVQEVGKGDRIGNARITAIAADAVILANARRLELP